MAFKGTLDTLSLVDVLQVIGMARKLGCLHVKHPTGEHKRLYFSDGDIVCAASTVAKEQLGAMLAKLRLLSPEQVAAAREAEQATGRKQGQAMIDAGLVTTAQLDHALQRQIGEIFNSVIAWKEGSFEFVDGERAPGEARLVRESVTNLVMEGTKQLDDWQQIARVFPSFDVVVSMVAAKAGADIRLQPDEWQILTLVDGRRTVRDICHLASATNFDVCRVLLHLHTAGLLATGPVVAPTTPNVSAPPPALRTVPATFLAAVQAEFTRMVGPIAPIILDEAAEALGLALDKLPLSRVPELEQRLCDEVDAPDKKAQLKDVIARAARR